MLRLSAKRPGACRRNARPLESFGLELFNVRDLTSIQPVRSISRIAVKLASPHWVVTGNRRHRAGWRVEYVSEARASRVASRARAIKHRSAPITSNARSQKERNDHAKNERSDRGEEREPAATQLAFARTCTRVCRLAWHAMPCHYMLGCGTKRAEPTGSADPCGGGNRHVATGFMPRRQSPAIAAFASRG